MPAKLLRALLLALLISTISTAQAADHFRVAKPAATMPDTSKYLTEEFLK